MKIRQLGSVVLVICIVLTGMHCRSEFEKARLSPDPEFILQKANEYYDEEDFQKAQQLYELVLSRYRGTKEAEEIYFKYAYTYYYLQQYLLAAHYFKNFANTFAYSQYKEEADYMSAYSNYQLSPVYRLDQEPTKAAIQGFQEFVNTHPASRRVPECNALIDELRAKLEEKAFANGQLYYDLKQYDAAIQTFENMLADFPETDRAELVNFRILESAFSYAENSIFEKRQERYVTTFDYYREFIRKYPNSEYRTRADKIMRQAQENIQNLVE